MPTTTLTNPTLKKLSDINQNIYYLLVNPANQDEVYFCFAKTVVAGWNQLVETEEQNIPLSQVTIEYQEQERGIRIYRQALRVEIS